MRSLILEKKEMVENKLILMDNLVKLKKAPKNDFENQKEICRSLISKIKEMKKEIIVEQHRNEEQENMSTDGNDIKSCILLLRSCTDRMMNQIRNLNGLYPTNWMHPFFDLDYIKHIDNLLFSRSNKRKIIKEFEIYLVDFCGDLKKIIIKLDNINYPKDYDFDLEFTEYYIEVFSRNIKKDRYSYADVIAIYELYKKIYKIIDFYE